MIVMQTVPWFNESFRALKSKRRKLERKMLKSGLQSDITVKAGQAYPPRFYY